MRRKDEGDARGARPVKSLEVDEARERAIDLLSECFARDMLSVEDFERRVAVAHAAGSMAELGEAIEGLGKDGTAPAKGEDSTKQIPRGAPPATFSEVRPTDRAVAVFGETKRAGQWVPARRNTAVAVMGSVRIDLREARLGPGTTTITAVTFMGSVEVLTPPGMHVQCAGSAVFGSFEHGDSEHGGSDPAPVGPDESMVRVDGFSVFGSVEIETRHVGESGREAKRRRRLERKRRKRRLKKRKRLKR